MKQSTYKTTTYELGKGWMIDITEFNEDREAWLYRIDTGIKTFIFGRDINADTYEDFLNMVIVNYPDYMVDYMHDYA